MTSNQPLRRADALALSKNSLMAMGREYWEIYLPGKYQELLAAGRLRDALACAADMTLEAMESLRASGMSRWDAWQAAGSRHLLLPEEPRARARTSIRLPTRPSKPGPAAISR